MVNCFGAARDAFPAAANLVNPSPGLMGHNIVCAVAEAQKILTFSVCLSVTEEMFR